MFPYTEIYIEFHKIIQNNNLLYKTHPKHQNTFSKIIFYPNQHFPKIRNSFSEVFHVCRSWGVSTTLLIIFRDARRFPCKASHHLKTLVMHVPPASTGCGPQIHIHIFRNYIFIYILLYHIS